MPIRYEKNGEHVVLITIDRPETKNALDLRHFHDLARAWSRFDEDADAWVAIVTGVDGCFMAGADLKTYIPEVTRLAKEIKERRVRDVDGFSLSDGVHAVLRDVEIYKPIIAAVGGPCVAGGMEMLGGADIRIATPDASFGVLEPARGLFAGGGTTARLPRQIAYPAAMEFLLTAERFSAEDALRMELLNRIVPEESLFDEAYAFAGRIVKNAPLAVRATKESVLRGLLVDLEGAYRVERELSQRVFGTEDAKEGPKAFAEKRRPIWKGR